MVSSLDKFNILVAVLAVVAVIFITYPPPELSKNLKAWRESGKYFKFRGHRIFYVDFRGSRKDVAPLMLLHGFPTSSYDWYKMLPDLKQRFSRVIAIDFLGFGFSDKPRGYDYRIWEQTEIVQTLLVKLGIKEFHVLAHDYGDTVTQEFLHRYEQDHFAGPPKMTVLSVCLLNGGIYPVIHQPRVMQKLLLVPYVGPLLGRLTFYFAFKFGFSEIFGPNTRPSEEEYSDFWATIRFNDGNLVMHRLLSYIQERFVNEDNWVGVLQTTSVPVHIIYGPADPVNPPAFIPYAKKVTPRVTMSVLDKTIGHYVQLEDPKTVVQEYDTFMARTTAESAGKTKKV
ncbi:mesoderm-specific transcript protein-like [Lineus longissimus]|uniref:mesoderm-specific transcript protein-like n=1 Tax=Lineus longissimus TaxID=88925 RepID=UPI002B4F19A8